MSYKTLIISFILLTSGKPLTEQTPDILLIENQTFYLTSFPLDDLKLVYSEPSDSVIWNTACWRGYKATWTVRNDSLFLTRMMDCYNKYEIDIPSYLSKRTSNLHPAGSELFADWYNAELVNYKHPYLSIKESANYLWRIDWRELTEDEEVILTFKNGILVKKPD